MLIKIPLVIIAHIRAHAGAHATNVALQPVQSESKSVDRIDDKLHLRLLFIPILLNQSKILVTGIASLRPRARVHPVLAEPRIARVIFRSQRGHIVIKSRDVSRLQLDRDGAHGLLLIALHELSLSAPTVTRNPLERLRQVRPSRLVRRLQNPPSVLSPREKHHRPRVRLLRQFLNDVIKSGLVRSARHLFRRGDTDVAIVRLGSEMLDTRLAVGTFGVHRGDVRPVEALHHVHQSHRLKVIRRYRSSKVVEPGFVTEGRGGGRRRDLRDVEESQEIGYLERNRTVRSADDAEHRPGLEVGFESGRGLVLALEGAEVEGQRGPDEMQTLFESVGVSAAGVEDVHPQGDVRQDRFVGVDLVDSEEHRLETLHAAVVDLRTAGGAIFLVDGKEAAQNDVAGQLDGFLLGLLGFLRLREY